MRCARVHLAAEFQHATRRLDLAAVAAVRAAPGFDAPGELRAADVVITITGSTAFEAVLYEKPVITLGRTCYDSSEMIHYCPDVRNLPALIRRLSTQFQPDKEALLCLISAVIAGPRTLEQWNAYLTVLDCELDEEDEALIDSLVPPGHPSTPGYSDPAYPCYGRIVD